MASSPSQSRGTGSQEQAGPQNQSTSERGGGGGVACLLPPHLIDSDSSRVGDGKAQRPITHPHVTQGQTLGTHTGY